MMKNVLKDFVHQLDAMNTIGGGVTATTVNIDKHTDNIPIRINAPTLSSDSFNIFLQGNQLVVYSVLNGQEVLEENQFKEAARHMVPIFNRVFDIPPMVDREQIDAVYEEGLLKVIMPFNSDPSMMNVKRIDIREY